MANQLLDCRGSNITIAGETSPGGVIIRDYKMSISNGSNLIMRFMRFRGVPSDQDGLIIGYPNAYGNVVIDHCSFAGSCDEAMQVTATNVTVCWTALENSRYGYDWHEDTRTGDPPGSLHNHNYGPMVYSAAGPVSLHHCTMLNHAKRCPNVGSPAKCESINNLIYNWDHGEQPATTQAEGGQINVIGCVYKYGPENRSGTSIPGEIMSGGAIYCSNCLWRQGAANVSNCASMFNGSLSGSSLVTSSGITQTPTSQVENTVLDSAGAFPRDAYSTQLITGARNATGHMQYDSNFVNSMPALTAYPKPADADSDGMPDWWEDSHGLDKNSAADGATLAGSGYSHLEEYCHYLASALTHGVANPWNGAVDIRSGKVRESEPRWVYVFPNPFARSLHVRVEKVDLGLRTVDIYDLGGRLIRNVKVEKGAEEAVWNGCDNQGRMMPTGLYVIRVTRDGNKIQEARVAFVR